MAVGNSWAILSGNMVLCCSATILDLSVIVGENSLFEGLFLVVIKITKAENYG